MTDVLVVAELLEGKARKTTHSAITAAKQIAAGGAVDILAIGEGAAAAAAELTGFGARKVLKAEIAGGYVGEKYKATVAEVAQKGGYKVVVATASAYGKDLLPRVAAKLGAGVASDITKVEVDGGKVVYTRPMYAGNVFGKLTVNSAVQVVTARQTAFEAAQPSGGGSAVEDVAVASDAT